MSVGIETFFTFEIKPGEKYKVGVPLESIARINQISVSSFPSEGRVIVYAYQPCSNTKVAIASLTMNREETIPMNLVFNSCDSLVFSTEGDAISVTISGSVTNTGKLSINKVADF